MSMFGEKIKKLRKAAGLSQRQLAENLGISIKSIQRYEKNENPDIPVVIHTEFIKLQDAMKYANIVYSGGEAKSLIQEGEVLVNGEVCTMRGKKLYNGDKFTFAGQTYLISYHS